MTTQQLVCLKCGHIDMVRRVTTMYTSGISFETYVGSTAGIATSLNSSESAVASGYTTLRGTSQTSLSLKVAPPKEPQPKGFSGLLLFFGWLMGLGGGLFTVASLCTMFIIPAVIGMNGN